jgi:hypothetical protein
MKNPHLTFCRKVNQQAVTVSFGQLVGKTENAESIAVTYRSIEKVIVLGLRVLVMPIRNRQVASSSPPSAAFFASDFAIR